MTEGATHSDVTLATSLTHVIPIPWDRTVSTGTWQAATALTAQRPTTNADVTLAMEDLHDTQAKVEELAAIVLEGRPPTQPVRFHTLRARLAGLIQQRDLAYCVFRTSYARIREVRSEATWHGRNPREPPEIRERGKRYSHFGGRKVRNVGRSRHRRDDGRKTGAKIATCQPAEGQTEKDTMRRARARQK